MEKVKNKWTAGRIILYLVILLITFLIIYPFLYCVAYSLSSSQAVMTKNVTFYPIGFTLENYKRVFKQNHLASSFLISVLRTFGGYRGERFWSQGLRPMQFPNPGCRAEGGSLWF